MVNQQYKNKNMKYIQIFLATIAMITFLSCNNQNDFPGAPGNPQITAQQVASSAYFGDSIPFSVTVNDDKVALSTVKVQLYYGSEMVSENTIRTKENGTYNGKLFAPLLKNVPDGTATIKFVLQDIHFTLIEKELPITLQRPQYDYIDLITEAGKNIRLLRTGPNTYSAATTTDIPQMVKGLLITPKFGANGNNITFGWDETIKENSTTPITFLSLAPSPYNITFNSLSFERTPFTVYKMNGKDMSFADNKFVVDLNLKKGDIITTENIANISNFWIDPDFFNKTADGKIQFAAIDGKYRIIVDESGVPYLRVQTLDSNGNKATLKPDGTGAIWIAGWGIAKPALTTGQPGWNPGQMLNMAPIAPKVYRMTVTASNEKGLGQIRTDWIGFKFFYQDDWGGELKKANYAEMKGLIPSVITISDSGDFSFTNGKGLTEGKTFLLTIDCTNGTDKAIISFIEK